MSPAHTRKQSKSLGKEDKIESDVSRHLEVVSGLLSSEKMDMDECGIENADDIEFVLKGDIGRTWGFASDKKVKCTDSDSDEERFSIFARLSGSRKAIIQPRFMQRSQKVNLIYNNLNQFK